MRPLAVGARLLLPVVGLLALYSPSASSVRGLSRSIGSPAAQRLAHPVRGSGWAQRQGPVLVADQGWEDGVVQEPTVLQVGDSLVMWYSGGWYDCTMGVAVSGDGINWRKLGRVLGDGAGDEAHDACHSSVSLIGGTFYAFYSAAFRDARGRWGGFGTYYATSPDGFRWQARGLALATGAWDLNPANTAVWVEHGVWYMLYDTATNTPALWLMTLAIGTGPATWFKTNHVLERLSLGGAFGGPSITRTGRGYRIDYLAARSGVLPTDIYESESPDLEHWDRPRRVVVRGQPWEFDQVADPSVVGDRMWFDGMNNVTEHGSIGLAERTSP